MSVRFTAVRPLSGTALHVSVPDTIAASVGVNVCVCVCVNTCITRLMETKVN